MAGYKMEKGCYGYSNDGYQDMIDALSNSWTWRRLTDEEKSFINNIFELARGGGIVANADSEEYKKEWNRCGDIYHSCLFLLGCRNGNFRENSKGQPDMRTRDERINDFAESIKDKIIAELTDRF